MDVRHLHLASRDHAVSKKFYGDYFGFRFDAEFPRGEGGSATIIRSPANFQIYLEADSADALPAWFHFGFLVDSIAECKALHDRMVADGVEIIRPYVTEPFANYFFADPDGHTVQVYFDPTATR
ncbi:MAG: VOC family protein [Kofleriaceae bacterium]